MTPDHSKKNVINIDDILIQVHSLYSFLEEQQHPLVVESISTDSLPQIVKNIGDSISSSPFYCDDALLSNLYQILSEANFSDSSVNLEHFKDVLSQVEYQMCGYVLKQKGLSEDEVLSLGHNEFREDALYHLYFNPNLFSFFDPRENIIVKLKDEHLIPFSDYSPLLN